jgi:integrase
MKDIEPEGVQRFLMSLRVAPKTVRNIFVTLQIMWKSARAWKYVSHDVTEGAMLPQRTKPEVRHFTVEEIQRILLAADEPFKTFYWLAIETGMRAGELCALRGSDVYGGRVHVRQSVWRGKFGEPKTANAVRAFAISAPLAARLGELGSGLLFHTRNGTPWDANLLVKRKLYPLLDSLGIARGGLHAFRHANASMMDALAVPMKVRQERLGHSDITLTMNVYTHIASEDDTQAAEQIAGVLWPNVAKSKKEGLPENQEALVIQ